MNELLVKMADDLSIFRFERETDRHYAFRVCYSALACWMILQTQSKNGIITGVSKHLQTSIVENLLCQYCQYFKLDAQLFPSEKNDPNHFSHHIRRVYEETGYLFSDEQNNSIAANYNRTIGFDGQFLFFGIPNTSFKMNGLGIYCQTAGNETNLFEAMLRDTIPVSEYIEMKYDWLDFEERDFDTQSLLFFNPTLRKSPSASWERKQTTIASLARDSNRNLYRTFITPERKILFADERIGSDNGRLFSSEYRRLYIALKALHEAPVIAWITNIDDTYSSVHISAQLPNREYYFMLLMGWPERNAYDKNWFICKNSLVPIIYKMLTNIGIQVRR